MTPSERDVCEQRARRVRHRIYAYQRAINRIDDYFEYQMESKVDQAAVKDILQLLTKELANE